jgi:hypothetical protein
MTDETLGAIDADGVHLWVGPESGADILCLEHWARESLSRYPVENRRCLDQQMEPTGALGGLAVPEWLFERNNLRS